MMKLTAPGVILTTLLLGCSPGDGPRGTVSEDRGAVTENPAADEAQKSHNSTDTTRTDDRASSKDRAENQHDQKSPSPVPRPEDSDPINAPARTDKEVEVPLVDIASILESDSLVGHRVRVRGQCMGLSGAPIRGPKPLTRSDWQLQSGDDVIYVSGPLPSGCGRTEGSNANFTLPVEVAEDSIPLLNSDGLEARRFLIRVDE